METMHKILKRFAESEKRQQLSTHKIELNILQNAEDALKALKKAKSDSFKRTDKLTKDGEKYAQQINKIINNYKNEIESVEKMVLKQSDVQSAISALKRIEQTAKDLGLKASEVPIYKKLSKELDGAEDLPDDIKYAIDRKYSAFEKQIRF
jgi:sugar-specific transcriptional regulator TrmB